MNKPNCKECITFPMCKNLLMETTYQSNIGGIYQIRLGGLQKKCSIFAEYVVFAETEQLQQLVRDILNLHHIPDYQLSIWKAAF